LYFLLLLLKPEEGVVQSQIAINALDREHVHSVILAIVFKAVVHVFLVVQQSHIVQYARVVVHVPPAIQILRLLLRVNANSVRSLCRGVQPALRQLPVLLAQLPIKWSTPTAVVSQCLSALAANRIRANAITASVLPTARKLQHYVLHAVLKYRTVPHVPRVQRARVVPVIYMQLILLWYANYVLS
jgi:hypothetical protein